MNNILTYWVALAHANHLVTRRKNEIVVNCFHHGETLAQFFMASQQEWTDRYGVTADELPHLLEAREGLPNCSFLVEDLLNQGYRLIPITAEEYPKALKQNLKYNAPLLLYAKGNTALLNQSCVAVVGARSAGAVSLRFTKNVAQRAAASQMVVVSGYAKGVDAEALNAAVATGGSSIVVLPQGITTFGGGYQALHRAIATGKVVVTSAFHPNAPWSVALAMARNPLIYAFAEQIFVAESDATGGTFAGATDGLRRGRTIFVRQKNADEKCANDLLVDMGATPVDMNGNPLATAHSKEAQIVEALTNHARTAKELSKLLFGQDDRAAQARAKMLLKRIEAVETLATTPQKFIIRSTKEPTLF